MRALASDSESFILDEPASALDLRNQARVLAMVRELAHSGTAIMLTTHHPDHAPHLADHTVLMGGPDGTRIGPAKTMLTDQPLGELYGVAARTVTFDDEGTPRTVLTTRYP